VGGVWEVWEWSGRGVGGVWESPPWTGAAPPCSRRVGPVRVALADDVACARVVHKQHRRCLCVRRPQRSDRDAMRASSRITGQIMMITGQIMMITGQIMMITGQIMMITGQIMMITGQIMMITGQIMMIAGQIMRHISTARRLCSLRGEARLKDQIRA
jgi:hypothetical protein